jgi:hypothetical protein
VINGEQVRRVVGSKFLGVWVDAELKWRCHIDKVGGSWGMLGRAKADLDEHLFVSLYNNMVLPHLLYCLMVWGNFVADRNKAQGEALLKLQKWFVGLIAGKGGRYHGNALLPSMGSSRWGTYISSS